MIGLINNYYISNLIYTIVVCSLSFGIIQSLNKKNVYIKNKLVVKNVNINAFLKYLLLSFFIIILLEQIGNYFNLIVEEEIIKVGTKSIIVFFVVRCIVAPITEEIIFRFGLFEFLRKKINKKLSYIIVSVLFTIIHGYSLYNSVMLFCMSFIWTYSYYKKENLLYPIVLHFFFNLYALISLFNIPNMYYIVLVIICFVLFLLLSLKKKG